MAMLKFQPLQCYCPPNTLSRLQVDMSPDVRKSGRSLVLMMCASGEEVKGVAVQVVRVYGHSSTPEEQQTMSFLHSLVSGSAATNIVT